MTKTDIAKDRLINRVRRTNHMRDDSAFLKFSNQQSKLKLGSHLLLIIGEWRSGTKRQSVIICFQFISICSIHSWPHIMCTLLQYIGFHQKITGTLTAYFTNQANLKLTGAEIHLQYKSQVYYSFRINRIKFQQKYKNRGAGISIHQSIGLV